MIQVNDASTIYITAKAATDRFFSRAMRLAYFLSEVLERIAVRQEPPLSRCLIPKWDPEAGGKVEDDVAYSLERKAAVLAKNVLRRYYFN